MQAQAQALEQASSAVESGASSDLVRGQAHEARSAASDAIVALGSRPGDRWFSRAQNDLRRAQTYLVTAINQGGLLDAKLCASQEIQTALPNQCSKVVTAATLAQAATANLNDLVARRQAAFDLANKAWKLADDSIKQSGADDDTRPTEAISFVCKQTIDECLQYPAQHADRIGWYVGAARYFARPPEWYGEPPTVLLRRVKEIEAAELCAKTAMDEAQRIADQSSGVQAAIDACSHNQDACKSACRGGDGPGCYAWAMRLWGDTQSRRADAKVAMQRACDAGLRIGCSTVARIDEQMKIAASQAAAQIDNAWSDVQDAGDDLTVKRFQIATVGRVANTTRTQISLERMKAITAAIVTEKFCPARAAFIKAASAAEYQRRATAHCRDQAPTGTGLSGAAVTLTADCQAVYSTPCP